MLTPGNKKLDTDLIWGFGLPSGRAEICVGMTPTCREHCYARRTELYRVTAAARYEDNLRRSRRRDFARHVRAFLTAHHVRVVRVHTGGEFYSARYAAKWLAVVRRSPRVRFFAYTRAWRVPGIRGVLESLAAEPNCQLWYSVDRDTGLPADVPAPVRLAWMMAALDDFPPGRVGLTFRVKSLRRQPLSLVHGGPVCPAEDGTQRSWPMTCDRCRYCWRPAPTRSRGVLKPTESRSEPVIPPTESSRAEI